MKTAKTSKFSPLAYVESKSRQQSTDLQGSSKALEQRRFRLLVDELRQELIAYRGRSEAETSQFGETLNRAILGFEQERAMISAVLQELLAKRGLAHLSDPAEQYATMSEAIFAELIGWNVLELILRDKGVIEEIQVIGTQIFLVKGGDVSKAEVQFKQIADVERIQQNLVLFNRDTISEKKKWAEVSLQDGSRVTMTGFGFTSEPTMTLRFYRVQHFSLQMLSQAPLQTISPPMVWLLQGLILSCFNLVIVGATNSGKTHLLKAMLAEIPDAERVVTLESRFELMLRRDFPNKNMIEFEYDEHSSTHHSSQAFKLALRQSPKRIIQAEMRDEDANLYVRACTRGHEGSMTTVHVSNLEDAPDAIADMCMLDGRMLDARTLRQRIAKYVTQIGIQLALVGKQRKIVRIVVFEVQDDEILTHSWVTFDAQTNHWTWHPIPKWCRAHLQIKSPELYQRLEEEGCLL